MLCGKCGKEIHGMCVGMMSDAKDFKGFGM